MAKIIKMRPKLYSAVIILEKSSQSTEFVQFLQNLMVGATDFVLDLFI